MQIYPGETLFSVLTRIHLMSGAKSTAATNQVIFGKKRKRVHCYLPSALDQVAEVLKIDLEVLLKENTLFAVYEYFLTKEKSNDLYNSMTGNCKFLPSNVIDSKSPLFVEYSFKYCPICMQVDIDKYGIPYWHIGQQLPSISVCPSHNCLLHSVPGGDKGVSSNYILPYRVHPILNSNKQHYEFSVYCQQFLYELRKNRLPSSPMMYQKILRKLHLIKGNDSLNLQRLESIYFNDQKLRSNGFNRFLTLNQIYRFLRHPDENFHPIKHLAILYLMTNKVKNLMYIINLKTQTQLTETKEFKVDSCSKINLLFSKGLTMNAIANKLHCSRGRIKRILKSNQLISLSELEIQVCTLGFKGVHREKIAKRLKLSIGYVEQILSMVKGLPSLRKDLKKGIKEKRYKKDILDFLKRYPSCLRKDVKLYKHKEFYWLYVNSKEWLERHLPTPTKPHTVNFGYHKI